VLDINGWEMVVLALLALFIFGPERLPKVIGDAARVLRSLRNMARNATNDLSRELGTDVRLEDLNPRTFVRKHLLSEESEAALRRPIDEFQRDLRQIAAEFNGSSKPGTPRPPAAAAASAAPAAATADAALVEGRAEGEAGRFDADAT
jgi:sec-independent protein translocase protein TatB